MSDPQSEARAWFERLGRRHITNADLSAFRDWRDVPENDAAYSAIELGRGLPARFAAAAMQDRFRVVDQWTGEIVVHAGRPLQDLRERDARRTAAFLNRGPQAQ